MKNKKSAWALPVCFFLMIVALTIAFFALPKQTYSENEKRVLSEAPKFSFAALTDGSITSDTETYIADHFPFRSFFVGLHAYAQQIFGQNGDSGVYRGKDGYLFATQGEIDLDRTAANVQKVRAFAAQNGLETTWLLVPCAGSMLEDKLPRFRKAFRDGEVFDTVKQACAPDLFLDARECLAAADGQAYYKTDHHLTSKGSLALYEAYCAAKGLAPQQFTLTTTSEGFYGTAYSKSGLWLTKPDTLEIRSEAGGDYTVTITEGAESKTYDSLYFPDHLNEKDQYPVFLDGNHSVVKIENHRCKNGKKLLILKDSFAHCFTTFLAANYETIVMVDLRYDRESLAALVEKEGLGELLVLYGAENYAASSDFAWLAMM